VLDYLEQNPETLHVQDTECCELSCSGGDNGEVCHNASLSVDKFFNEAMDTVSKCMRSPLELKITVEEHSKR
jgi:hypothetical protein